MFQNLQIQFYRSLLMAPSCSNSSRKHFSALKHLWTYRYKFVQHFPLFVVFSPKSAKKQLKSTFGLTTPKWSKIISFCSNDMIENAGKSWDLPLQNYQKKVLIELSYLYLINSWKLAHLLAKIAQFQRLLKWRYLNSIKNYFS